ncbi:MAG: CopG family transcriptional regulator [Candidatus Methanomethylicaceae archaeon]
MHHEEDQVFCLTIQLPEDLYLALRRAAETEGVSAAEIIRRALRAYVPSDRGERALAVVGAFEDRATDVAERHDHYLAEALDERVR